MNVVITIFASSLLMFHALVSVNSLQNQPSQSRKSYRYELLHPEFTTSLSRSKSFFSSPVEIATRLPSFLPRPKFEPQPQRLVPNVLNNLFQGSSAIKGVTNNFLPDFLFTPNSLNEAAATLGQIENYNKDLEELEKEEEQERNNATASFLGRGRREPTLFVSVTSGLYNYNYTVS